MKLPSTNNINIICDKIQEITKKECIKIVKEGPLASLLFHPISRMPIKITEFREELEDNGYLFFYSTIREGKNNQEFLSFNITKI